MATYVLIPGAGGRAWYWHRLAPGCANWATTSWRLTCPPPTTRPGLSNTPTPWSRQLATAANSSWSPSQWLGSPRPSSASACQSTSWSC